MMEPEAEHGEHGMTEPHQGLPSGSEGGGETHGAEDYDSTIISGGSTAAEGGRERPVTKIWVREFGGFELLAELGHGGMGVVYRARQTSPDREVALKMIHAGRFAAGNFRKRFELEAEAVGNLRHPNIVSLFESGEIDGNLFYTMPLIEGMTLSRSIAEERWGIRESVELVAKLAEAIGHAHQRGVLHRDLKPANIMIDGEREPFVTDFGLAKMIGDPSKDLTMPGAVMGSPAYMAPEQAGGRTDEISTATDVYGLGIILYHLVTGNLPFRGETAARVLQDVLYTEPARPLSKTGRVDRDLSTIILKCLAKEPARRYATAEALGGDLQRWLAGRPIEARPVGLPTRVCKWVRRRPTLAALIAVTVTLSSVAVIGIAREKRNLFRQLIETRLQQADDEAEKGNVGRALARWSNILRLKPGDGLAAERITEMLRNRNFARREGGVIQTGVAARVVALSPTNGLSYVGSATNGGRVWSVTGSAPVADLRFEGLVSEAVFSRDGTWFLMAHWADGTNSVMAWDTRSGERVFQLPTTKHLGKIAVSPDRSRLFTHTRSAGPMLWDVSDPDRPVGRPLSVPEKLTSYDRSQVEIDGTGNYAVVAVGTRVVVWDCRDGELVLDAKVGFGLARGLSFDESGTLLAAGSMSSSGRTGHLYLWNLKNGEPVPAKILLHGAPVSCVGISPDGRHLVSGGDNRLTIVWDSESGEKLAEFPHQGNVREVKFDRSGERLLTVANDRSVRVWNVLDLRLETERIAHEAPVIAADFGPDGKTVQAVCADGSIHRWKIEPTQRLYRLYMPFPWVAFSPDGAELIAADSRSPGQVMVWDVKTGAEKVRLRQTYSRQVRFSPDGRQILSHGSKGQANLWHRTDSGDWLPVPFPLTPERTVQVSAFSPDGRFIATSETDYGLVPGWVNLRRLDARGSNLPVMLSPVEKSFRHRNWGYGLAFSPDGRRLASGTTFGEVFIRVVEGDGPELRLEHGPERIQWLEFSPDSRLLGSACADGYGRLWDAATGKQYGPSFGHREEVVSIRFSPDGTLVATGSKDGNVQLWDVAKGTALLEPFSHAEAVTFVAFSPDGSRIATAAEDGIAQVWDVMTGQATTSPLIHGAAVMHLAFSPDGKWLATGCQNGNVRMWRMDNAAGPGQAADLIERAERLGGFRMEESRRIRKLSEVP